MRDGAVLRAFCYVCIAIGIALGHSSTETTHIGGPRDSRLSGERSEGIISSVAGDSWQELKEFHSDREQETSRDMQRRSLPGQGDSRDSDIFLGSMREETTHETRFVAECDMPSTMGNFRMRAYTYRENGGTMNKLEPIVVVAGDVSDEENVLVRVHDQCFTSEVFGSRRCDCREQLQESMKLIRKTYEETGRGGIVIYLQQEGRGIGLPNKIAAYSLQDQGMDTVDANHHLGFADELREYRAVPDILQDMGVKSIRLITNNPYKVKKLQESGVHIAERVPMELESNQHNLKYLRTKKMRMNHVLRSGLLDKKGGYAPAAASGHPEEVLDMYDAVNVDQTTGELKGYTQDMGRASVVAAIQAVKEGQLVLVVDDESRENEGDFIMAAEKATPEAVGIMVRYSSGVLCVSMGEERLQQLKLPPMVQNNEDPKGTAYTISVDAKAGTSTGISASDRATTFRMLANPKATADDFYRPGHVFPLRYTEGGVLRRAGHTEASRDLCELAGLQPCGVLCEVVHDDGSMQRLPDLKLFAEEKGLVLTSIQDLVAYRNEMESD